MNKIFNWIFGSFFRTIGRLLVYILIGFLLSYFLRDLKLPKINISDLVLMNVSADTININEFVELTTNSTPFGNGYYTGISGTSSLNLRFYITANAVNNPLNNYTTMIIDVCSGAISPYLEVFRTSNVGTSCTNSCFSNNVVVNNLGNSAIGSNGYSCQYQRVFIPLNKWHISSSCGSTSCTIDINDSISFKNDLSYYVGLDLTNIYLTDEANFDNDGQLTVNSISNVNTSINNLNSSINNASSQAHTDSQNTQSAINNASQAEINNATQNKTDIINNQNANKDALINNQNSNSQSQINNATQNKNDIINNQNSNSQAEINNANANTDKTIDSQKVCTYIDKQSIAENNKIIHVYDSQTGIIENNNNFGITDYINIKSSKIEVLTTRTGYAGLCFYNVNKEIVSCISNLNLSLGELDIPNNSNYVRFTIQTTENKPTFNICKNGNQATNDTLNDMNSSINNSDSSQATNDASNFFSNFTTDTHGLTGIITAPLNAINSLTSSSCSPLVLPLPFVNENLTLPCMRDIYEQYFGQFMTLYDVITLGIVSYWILVRIFSLVKDFKNPEHDEVEVLDL